MKDLLKLYSFESVHGIEDEQRIFEWICKWLTVHNISFQTYNKNIYNLSKVGAPILSAHLDQVQTNGKAVKFYMVEDDIVAYNENWERTSLGADDKNGIWIILKLLEAGADFNFIISYGEEVGCVGIKELCTAGILEQIITDSYCLVLDRKGFTDTLHSGAGTTFNKILSQTISNFTEYFVPASGSCSDTVTLSNYCESTNLSVAYENPHTSNESTNFKKLCEIKDMVLGIVNNMVFYPCKPSVYHVQKPVTVTPPKDWRTYYGY